MPSEQRDPWVDVKTYHGLPADHVISALQKEIRRGEVENAALLALEMVMTSPALEDYLWRRLLVIAVEDIGFGEPQAPILLNALFQTLGAFDRNAGERKLFAIHAVRYLCRCQKDRSSDEMAYWLSRAVAQGQASAAIPDYALDMHTATGQAMGRDHGHFFAEAAKVYPEAPDRDRTYWERIMKGMRLGSAIR